MATAAVLDPYQVLGVESNADAVAIKKAYRKLVLSCHPDKVTDESLKEQKQEEFHQIQQAYETVGDPDKRNKYELELKAKKLRDERERAAAKTSPTQSRHVHIFTAEPAEYRSSSSKYSPTKPSSYRPEFSKSWEANISSRSKGAFEAERRTRRTYSDDKLNEDSRERRRKEDDRERRRRQQQQEEDEAQRRKQAKREKEAALEREARARARDARKREEERELRAREEKAALKKLKERNERERESRRRQDAEEKARARTREHSSEDDEERKSRAKKSSKKDSPRDKTPSKARARPREEVVPDLPVADPVSSKLDFAAAYMLQTRSKSTSAKVTPEAAYSEAYPDPNKTWAPPKRRSSGDKQATAEPAIYESTPVANPTSPPRLHKSYTMGYTPVTDVRPSLGRSQTFDAEAFSRRSTERPRMRRQHTVIDDEDFYTPPVHKSYTIGREKGLPRVVETSSPQSHYRDAYAPLGGSFSKIKTAPAYGVEHVSRSKRYDPEDIAFADFRAPQQQSYVAT